MWFEEIGMDGYHAIEPSAGMDIMAVRKRWPKLLLHGNLDCGRLLTLGSKAEIEDEVVRLIRGLAPRSGYVFSSSNSIHSGVPVENLTAMLNALRHHGTYPIAEKAGLF
jgi:uroporphyrinogen decarboxylase